MPNTAVLRSEVYTILDDVLADDPARAAEVKFRLRLQAKAHPTGVPPRADAAPAEDPDLWDNVPV